MASDLECTACLCFRVARVSHGVANDSLINVANIGCDRACGSLFFSMNTADFSIIFLANQDAVR
ncbi:hypothetical protein T4E_10302 [Trichinella pseudospiralis]|uniref:Uncharacterized protein n=1 Tax=Trichinella pseudospiralis TaxID=6337 RepID=A0A0V0XD22_TRIPS|nr:hypothetical protein T4E_10302 [Trichinella pseudospiralis]